jgi:AraC-like DNA-binding protein
MASIVDDFTSFHFSTAKVPPADRFAMWYDVFGRSVSRRELAMLSGGSCTVDMDVQALARNGAAGVTVQRMTLSGGISARRTPELLSDGNDDVILTVHGVGTRIASQVGREVTVAPGGGVLSSNADTSFVIFPERTRFVAIGLPRRLMTTLVPALEDALMRPLPADSCTLKLLMRYLAILDEEESLATPELRRAVASHIHDLCALAIGATRDAAEIARRRGLRSARLRAIKADIEQNLSAEGLSAASLARRHRVTPRYIHKLFEAEGVTLSQFVLRRRLARVHGTLADPRYAGSTIGAIAFEAGFGDLSTFNRAFRRQFGATPSDIRSRMRDGGAVQAVNSR